MKSSNIKDLIDTNKFFLIKYDYIQSSQYKVFRQKEINELLKKNVFKIINHEDVFKDIRIFNFRFVNEIKHFNIDLIYEKSRLMIQIYNDLNKDFVLI